MWISGLGNQGFRVSGPRVSEWFGIIVFSFFFFLGGGGGGLGAHGSRLRIRGFRVPRLGTGGILERARFGVRGFGLLGLGLRV